MPKKKYESGYEKRKKKQKNEQLNKSQQGAMDKFILKQTPLFKENDNEENDVNVNIIADDVDVVDDKNVDRAISSLTTRFEKYEQYDQMFGFLFNFEKLLLLDDINLKACCTSLETSPKKKNNRILMEMSCLLS